MEVSVKRDAVLVHASVAVTPKTDSFLESPPFPQDTISQVMMTNFMLSWQELPVKNSQRHAEREGDGLRMLPRMGCLGVWTPGDLLLCIATRAVIQTVIQIISSNYFCFPPLSTLLKGNGVCWIYKPNINRFPSGAVFHSQWSVLSINSAYEINIKNRIKVNDSLMEIYALIEIRWSQGSSSNLMCNKMVTWLRVTWPPCLLSHQRPTESPSSSALI